MKVLWLTPGRSGPPSGGDLYGSLMVAGLRRLGHRVEVRSSLPARVTADVVVEDGLGFSRLLPFNRALERAGSTALRVGLVHVTTARLKPSARTAAREAAWLGSTQAAVFVSRQSRSESLRLLGQRALRALPSAVIPPGADRLPVRAHVAAPHLRLLCVGHLLPHKGQLALLDVFSRSPRAESRGRPTSLDSPRDEGRSLVLAGAGDGPYAAKVISWTKRVPGARWVGPLGRAALADALARTDVFVNASEYESWGMAAAEAQAAGVPVLSWSAGGLWEFLTPGVDSVRTRKPSLAPLADRALLARLKTGARKAAKHCRTWSTAAAELAAFLEGAR